MSRQNFFNTVQKRLRALNCKQVTKFSGQHDNAKSMGDSLGDVFEKMVKNMEDTKDLFHSVANFYRQGVL